MCPRFMTLTFRQSGGDGARQRGLGRGGWLEGLAWGQVWPGGGEERAQPRRPPPPVWGVRLGQARVNTKRSRPPATKVESWFLREMAQKNTQGSNGSPAWTPESQSRPLIFPPLATDNCPPLPHLALFGEFSNTSSGEKQGKNNKRRWEQLTVPLTAVGEATGSGVDRGPRPSQPGGAGPHLGGACSAQEPPLQESASSKQTC